MPPATLPAWAEEMRDLFRSGSVSQFILHGNLFDVVPAADGRLLSLKAFLDEVMFKTYDVVLHYNRGKGIVATKGGQDWGEWLQQYGGPDAGLALREPARALEFIDKYLLRALHLRALKDARAAQKIAVVIDFAEFVVPRGDPLNLGGDFSSAVIRTLGWANDPGVQQANIATVLLA